MKNGKLVDETSQDRYEKWMDNKVKHSPLNNFVTPDGPIFSTLVKDEDYAA